MMPFPNRAPAAPFQPVVMFTASTPADKLALAQVHTLQAEIAKTMDTERSRKQSIGVSEIGNECNKCVARKLSGLYPKPVDPSWKAQIGTFGHAGLEQHFQEKFGWDPWEKEPEYAAPPATDEAPSYYMERTVRLLEHKSLVLEGSCDLFVQGATFGVVTDWKFQGPPKLKQTAAGKVSQTYLVQMMGYGLGYELLGHLVTHVCLYALPRDGELSEAKPVLMRYDRQVAIDALARLTQMIDAAEVLEAAYPGEGWERLIRAQDTFGACWDCRGYEKQEAEPLLAGMFGDEPDQS